MDCRTYWASLSDEEKDWLYKFELLDKYGLTPVGDDPPTKDQLRSFTQKRDKRDCDVMNNSTKKILDHYYSKTRKPNNGPLDWNLLNPEEKQKKK